MGKDAIVASNSQPVAPRLSILIATLSWRNHSFRGLIDSLVPQIEAQPGGAIEVLAHWNSGEESIGAIRQHLMESAKGDYICFIDDDDGVPDSYCADILENMGEDYIGFEVQLFNDGRLLRPVYHSIKYGRWYEDEDGYYRGITHLNPIRREIALKGKFHTKGMGEDETWAAQVSPHVKTEKLIKRVMYFYHHNSYSTFFGGKFHPKGSPTPAEIEREWFRYV
jgi:hypothetical protein